MTDKELLIKAMGDLDTATESLDAIIQSSTISPETRAFLNTAWDEIVHLRESYYNAFKSIK